MNNPFINTTTTTNIIRIRPFGLPRAFLLFSRNRHAYYQRQARRLKAAALVELATMANLPDEKHITRISRTLSSTLRHNAAGEGLKLQKDGYANVAQLLALPKYKKLGLDFPLLQHIVETNAKQRYKMIRKPTSETVETADDATSALLPPDIGKDEDPSEFLIRANQGHSIELDSSLLLKPITAENMPPICIHATFYGALDAIITSGHLSRMSRTHIHCAPGLPGKSTTHPVTGEEIPAVKSGMRVDAEVLFYVDLQKALNDGFPFWISDNGVILTEGVEGKLPLEYVERIDDFKGRAGGGTLWTREEGTIKEWPKGGGGKKKFGGGGGNRGRR